MAMGNTRFGVIFPRSRLAVSALQQARLRAALGAYRLVFGQPRQEDLLAFLQLTHCLGDLNADLYVIDLSPSDMKQALASRR